MGIGRTAERVLVGALAASLLASLLATRPAPASAGAPEGPPAPPAAAVAKRALVLPTRVLPGEGADRSTFDLLIATALSELGLDVVDAAAARALDGQAPDLARARELYLGLEFEAALAAAAAVRDARRARGGDLLGDPALAEAELMMVRLLFELGRADAAKELAVALLEREPELRLDPVEYAPPLQALWLAAVERRAAMQPAEHPVDALAAVARAAQADYAVAAVRKRTADGRDWLVLQVVPAAAGDAPSRLPVVLGARGAWARDVRDALAARFGPIAPEGAPAAPAIPIPAPAPADGGKAAWYKSWWFWTSVGIVVVGGTAIGVGAWASQKEKDDGSIDLGGM